LRPYERMQPEASRRMKKMMRYVGIDVGKARCRAALMSPKGDMESEFFFENNSRGYQIWCLPSQVKTRS